MLPLLCTRPVDAFACREWLQLLWQWLQAHAPLAPFVGLPLLPIDGGRLAPLGDISASSAVLPPSATALQAMEAGTPAAHAHATPAAAMAAAADGPRQAAGEPAAAQLSGLLTQLGLALVDTHAFELPLQLLLRSHVHRFDGPGLLAALFNASAATQKVQAHTPQTASPQPAAGDGSTPGGAAAAPSSQGSARSGGPLSVVMAARVSALVAEDKMLLRRVLASERCMTALQLQQQQAGQAGSSGAHDPRILLQLLASLPIYTSGRGYAHPPAATALASPVAAAVAGAPPQQQQQPQFMALVGNCCLVPPGVDPRVVGALSSGFVVAGSEGEAKVLSQYLGVMAPPAAEVYRSHVLPSLASLPPHLRDMAVRGLLLVLPQLTAQVGWEWQAGGRAGNEGAPTSLPSVAARSSEHTI
jgi:sacsin